MKKSFLLLLLTVLTMTSFAQYSAVSYTSPEFTQFKSTKTFVVRTGNAKFDTAVESAVKESWKVTPIDFISGADFKTKINDNSASFITLITIIPSGNANQAYHYLALLNGGKKNLDKYGYSDMIAYSPINHWSDEPENTDCAWRVRNMLEAMVRTMDVVQKMDIKGNTKNIAFDLQDEYRKSSPRIKERTLLIAESSMSKGKKMTSKEIAALYPFKFEVCSREKIEKAIAERSTEFYYYQPCYTLNKCMLVFDPSNGEVLFMENQIMGMSLNKGNIEELTKSVKGIKK